VDEQEKLRVQRPLRVLHLICGLGGGGVERWLRDVIRLSSSEQLTHEVISMYPDLGGPPVYADELSDRGAFQTGQSPVQRRLFGPVLRWIRARERPSRMPKYLSFAMRLGVNLLASFRIAKSVYRFRPDVVHSHSGPDIISGLLLKVLLRKPLVHTVPCLFSQMEDANYHWLPRLYARFHQWIDRFSTGEARSELLAVGVPPSKILYDLGGVDLHAVARALRDRDVHREQVRRELGLPANSCIALSVGRLHPSKGHRHALEALPELLRRMPNLHWVVLGAGAEEAALRARAEELDVAPHTHLVGFRPDPLPYFAAGDLFLRTTIFEPENLSFYQSVALGLPAVGFDTGWPDLIDKVGHGALVTNGDTEALVDAASRILTLPDRGRGLGELARVYALEHLDVARSVSLLTSCYLGLGGRPVANERHLGSAPGRPDAQPSFDEVGEHAA
jgi:glycosyltransferase involved in cell wall biosynthesis